MAREWVLPPVAPWRPRNPGVGRKKALQRLESRKIVQARTRELTLTASLGALYVVASFVPVDKYVGGPGFITLAIIVSPLIAALLKPLPATIAAMIGSLGMALGQTGFFPGFQIPGLLIPIITIAAGSIAFHYKYGMIVPWLYVLAGAVFYVIYSGGTLLWLIPYIIVLVSLPLLLTRRLQESYRTGFLSFYTAMTEQVTLNVESIVVLGLPGFLWAIITPFMFFERTVATLGGAFAILALKNRFGPRLFQPNQVLEVSR